MGTLASMTVKLVADIGGFVDGMGDAESVASRTLGGIGSSVQTIGKAAIGGLGLAAGATGAAGLAFAKLAIDAAPIAGVQAAFAGLAESSDQSADQLLGALERGSAGMIAQRDLMQTYNAAAQLVSVSFANTLPDAMGYLGKVSAATGEDMGFLLDSLVRGVGRLSPAILDNLAIQVDLVSANETWAAAMGVSVDEMTKGQQQAAIMAQVMEKLAENTAAMPDIAGSAAAGVAGLSASFQNIKDRIGLALQPALGTVVGTLNNLLGLVLPPLVNFISTFVIPIFDTMAEVIQGIGLVIGDLHADVFGPDYPWEDVFPEWLADIAYKIQEIAAEVGPLVDQVTGWISNHVELKDVLMALGVAIASVVIPAIISIVAAVAPIIAVAVLLIAAIKAIRTAWETDWNGIRSALVDFWENSGRPALEAIWTWLQVNIPAAIERARAYWEGTLKPALATVWAFIIESVIPAIQDVVTWLEVNIPAAIERARAYWEETLKPALATVWAFITESVIPAIENVVTWLEVNIPLAIENARMAWEEILKPALEIVWSFIQDDVLPLFEALAEFFDVAFTLATTALAGLWENTLKPAFETVWTLIRDNVLPLFEDLEVFWTDTLKPAIETLASTIADTLVTAWNDFTTVVDWAKTNILEPAKDVFNAIGDAISKVIGWISDLTEKMRNITLPDWLTPGSPSPIENTLWGMADALATIGKMSGTAFPSPALSPFALGTAAPAGVGQVSGSFENYGTINLFEVESATDLLADLQGLTV